MLVKFKGSRDGRLLAVRADGSQLCVRAAVLLHRAILGFHRHRGGTQPQDHTERKCQSEIMCENKVGVLTASGGSGL